MNSIIATYKLETVLSLEETAELIAGEQSTGTFIRLSGETDAIRAACRAKVLSIEETGISQNPALNSAYLERKPNGHAFKAGIVKLAFPADNICANLPTLMATLAGNVFELGQLTAIRLLDFELTGSAATSFLEPQHGVAGTRKIAAVEDRPIFGTIVKPNIGLSAAGIADIVRDLAAAGVDFVKDDELLANPVFCSFKDRFEAVSEVLDRHYDKTGKQVLYAFNVSDDFDTMRQNIDLLAGCPGAVVMVSLNWVGHGSVGALRKHTDLPIHGHRNGFAAMTRSPHVGIAPAAYVKSWRLAGVDQLHVNGLQSKFWESDASVIDSAKACTVALGGCKEAMPVFSSGQWAGTLSQTANALHSGDFMFLCGGGIIGHPEGIAAGVQSVHQAWDVFRERTVAEDIPARFPQLHAAYQAFGGI